MEIVSITPCSKTLEAPARDDGTRANFFNPVLHTRSAVLSAAAMFSDNLPRCSKHSRGSARRIQRTQSSRLSTSSPVMKSNATARHANSRLEAPSAQMAFPRRLVSCFPIHCQTENNNVPTAPVPPAIPTSVPSAHYCHVHQKKVSCVQKQVSRALAKALLSPQTATRTRPHAQNHVTSTSTSVMPERHRPAFSLIRESPIHGPRALVRLASRQQGLRMAMRRSTGDCPSWVKNIGFGCLRASCVMRSVRALGLMLVRKL
jgi:hypothetical protein